MTDDADARIRASWRPDDIVAYEELRDLAVVLETMLVARARADAAAAPGTRAEASAVRGETLAIDGFDRKAVDSHTRRLASRIAQLRQEQRDG
ncbi:hypothetical protein [Microbacterium rhizosphaerae]|uniref:Uncharacterized protein n=1 Tax=Microbacterium rhizosphaerae TaxID=1678237 RepID=A0ABZ0SK15_9MICO|nr:hypothetical protein [Microbacterium rhizosphaerae]WPR89729.1 hypothetical protein SM116_00120 [Microbacterium rhizosphaerae]